MSTRIDRRKFLHHSALAGAIGAGFYINPTAAEESDSPVERLNIAAVGASGRAGANIRELSSQNIVAIADVDANLLDQGAELYPSARKYRDFRVMLEKEAENIDAVVVGTPDHTHAPASAMAMRMKKHVYCEKPLTHTVYEARKLAELAKENDVVTQMGTQIHSLDNYRRVVELVQTGAIGQVREAHVYVSVNYHGAKLVPQQKPANVDWDLWQGPSAQREYCVGEVNGMTETIAPYHWRWFWDYGTGGLGDFGCHYMDLVHWALKLRGPTKISASGPPPDPVGTSSGLTVKYEYPARGDLPPVKLTWNDGDNVPKNWPTVNSSSGEQVRWGDGQLFIGTEGMIISDYSQHRLLPEDTFADFKRPEPFIPKSVGHHNEWIRAIKNKGTTTCNFDYSGALTEAVLLGIASYRSGESIEWNANGLEATNSPKAQQFVHKKYRRGWEL